MNGHNIQNLAYADVGTSENLAQRLIAPRGFLARIAAAPRRYLRRMFESSRREYENALAIEHLRQLTDSQLRDIGITRYDIEYAVRHGGRNN